MSKKPHKPEPIEPGEIKSKKKKSGLRENIEAIVIAVILALFIRTFVVQAFKIPSGSMKETLQIGDHILVNKFIYGVKLPLLGKTLVPIKDPQRDDIVVFKYPENPKLDFIKRVVGVEGDAGEMSTIKMVGDAANCQRAIETARRIAEQMHVKLYSSLRLNFIDTEKVRLVESEQEYSSINEGFFHMLPKKHERGINMQAIGLLETQGLTGVMGDHQHHKRYLQSVQVDHPRPGRCFCPAGRYLRFYPSCINHLSCHDLFPYFL